MDGYALSIKGYALVNLGRNEEALDTFNKIIDINPNDEVFIESSLEIYFNFALVQ